MISTKRKDERLKLGLIIYIVELRASKYSKYGASHQQSTVRSSSENRLSSFIHGLKDINSYHEHPTHVASFEFISCRNMTFRSTIKSSVSTFAVHPQSQIQQESGTNPFVFTTQWNWNMWSSWHINIHKTSTRRCEKHTAQLELSTLILHYMGEDERRGKSPEKYLIQIYKFMACVGNNKNQNNISDASLF